jgi:hypothetical protein
MVGGFQPGTLNPEKLNLFSINEPSGSLQQPDGSNLFDLPLPGQLEVLDKLRPLSGFI